MHRAAEALRGVANLQGIGAGVCDVDRVLAQILDVTDQRLVDTPASCRRRAEHAGRFSVCGSSCVPRPIDSRGPKTCHWPARTQSAGLDIALGIERVRRGRKLCKPVFERQPTGLRYLHRNEAISSSPGADALRSTSAMWTLLALASVPASTDAIAVPSSEPISSSRVFDVMGKQARDTAARLVRAWCRTRPMTPVNCWATFMESKPESPSYAIRPAKRATVRPRDEEACALRPSTLCVVLAFFCP